MRGFLRLVKSLFHKPYFDKGGEDYNAMHQTCIDAYHARTFITGYWPTNKDCDALIWAGLAKYGGADLNLLDAKDSGGRWQRRPLKPHGSCNINGCDKGSKSSISNDQLLGLMHGLLGKDKGEIVALIKYAKKHKFIMGEPVSRIGEVILRPTLWALMLASIGKKTNIPVVYLTGSKDYVSHLTVLGIHLYGRIHGHIEGHMAEVLKQLIEDDPNNAQIEAVYRRYIGGGFVRAFELLHRGVVPSYVRGNPNYFWCYQLFTWSVINGK